MCFAAIPYTTCVFNGNSPEIRNLPRMTSRLISKLDRESYSGLCKKQANYLYFKVFAVNDIIRFSYFGLILESEITGSE